MNPNLYLAALETTAYRVHTLVRQRGLEWIQKNVVPGKILVAAGTWNRGFQLAESGNLVGAIEDWASALMFEIRACDFYAPSPSDIPESAIIIENTIEKARKAINSPGFDFGILPKEDTLLEFQVITCMLQAHVNGVMRKPASESIKALERAIELVTKKRESSKTMSEEEQLAFSKGAYTKGGKIVCTIGAKYEDKNGDYVPTKPTPTSRQKQSPWMRLNVLMSFLEYYLAKIHLMNAESSRSASLCLIHARKAVEYNPYNIEAWEMITLTLIAGEKFAEVVETYNTAIQYALEGDETTAKLKYDYAFAVLFGGKGNRFEVTSGQLRQLYAFAKQSENLSKEIFGLVDRPSKTFIEDMVKKTIRNSDSTPLIKHVGEQKADEKLERKTAVEPKESGNASEARCANCGVTTSLSRCGRCKKVFYCGRDCQRNDWKNHKSNCQ
eukprot:TRINITY_DN5306_c0_g1_i1.p1 TRINITY_DN5306_c0_g1~~TRINITY_DN5306_c0_g1_i1.p1  ORF type:complete len:441 (+),score=73.80 TRINITY_DN5306_c0_g1_i1:204-1526(+)